MLTFRKEWSKLLVTSIYNETELLTSYKNLTRKRVVNGDHSLSFLLPKTQLNEHSFDLVEVESVIEFENDEYRIKGISEKSVKETPYKQVQADHIFFDIIDTHQYDVLSTDKKSITQCLSHALKDTGFTFTIIDSFPTVLLENFGDDNALALFQDILNKFGAEYIINGNEVRIMKKIGSISDFQFRFKHNIKTFSRHIGGDNLSTYIKGFGKLDDNGNPIVTAEYTSPLANIFGVRHAPPVRDERYTVKSELLERIKSELNDTPEVRFELEFVALKQGGYPGDVPNLGDEVLVIYEPLKVDVETRIMEIEDYPESNQSPKITLANVKESFSDAAFSRTKKLFDKMYDESTGKLRYNVYDDAVRRASEALNNSLSELEYPEGQGIIARDPSDPNKFVAFNSAGLGVTLNGGVSFEEAITALGINTSLLTAGQIKTNNIQIIGNDELFYWDGNNLMAISPNDAEKYVKLSSAGLFIKKGHIEVEREDGFKTIIGGMLNRAQGSDVADPPFYNETDVEVSSKHYTTYSTSLVSCNFYTIQSVARYFVVEINLFTEGGATATASLERDGVVLATTSTTSSTGQNRTLVVDFGVPDNQIKSVYLKLKTSNSGKRAYVRKIRAWQVDYL